MNKYRIAVALLIYLIVLMPISFAQQLQEPEKKVDFYTITGVSISPSKGFDKRTVLEIAYPVYLQLRIRQKQANPKITAAAKTAQCAGENISESYMINENTNTPYIVVKSSPAIADVEKPVKVSCTMQLEIKQGKEIIGTELENFTVQIPVYNNPLGTVGENAKSQIDSIENRIKDLKKREERWEKVNDVFASIVGIAQAVAQADAESQYIGSALWGIASILYQLKDIKPWVGPICEAAAIFLWKITGCTIINNITHKNILRYIWTPGIIGSQIFSADWDVALGRISATLIKTTSAIYSCQLCDYDSSIYAGLQKSIYGDMNLGIGGVRGKPTALETFTVYNWNPYKSIHISMSCMCLPGIVYNMRKETQINCIYRNCIKQSAELGLPFDSCQQAFKAHNCLYVDGAAWRVAGGTYIAPLMSQQLSFIFEHLPMILLSQAWSRICDPDCGMLSESGSKGKSDSCGTFGKAEAGDQTAYPSKCADNPLDDWEVPSCGLWAGIMMQKETNYFADNRFPWGKYNADLKGEDYCD